MDHEGAIWVWDNFFWSNNNKNINNTNYNNDNNINIIWIFFFIKWKLKVFQITWANILFRIEYREHNKRLNGDILHLYPLNELISILMPATDLNLHFEKLQLGEHLATN